MPLNAIVLCIQITTNKPIYSPNDDITYMKQIVDPGELWYHGQLIDENYIVGFNYSRLESYKIN